MPAGTSPIFVQSAQPARARLAAANTARDGSGSLADLCTGAANGSRVESVTWTSAQASAAASSAMVGRVFITDENGLNPRLLAEVAIATVTASNTAIGATQTITFSNGYILKAGQKLQVSQSIYAGVQDQMDVTAKVGDF